MPTVTSSPASAAAQTEAPASGRRLHGRYRQAALHLDAATPADRDRLIDLLRVAAMLTVAFGHWLAAAVTVTPAGQLEETSLLVAAPWTQALTWLLQVMGLFFAVSGWSSAASLSRRDVPATRRWLASRLGRVLAPTALYVAVWSLVDPLVVAATPHGDLVGDVVAVQLWFVAVIVVVLAATPWLWACWRRWGWATLAVATGGALVVDIAHRVFAVPAVGWRNFILVWSVPALLGFAWHDGKLDSDRTRRALAVGGTLCLVALVASPWIPMSMVGVDGAAQSNNSPPSVALIALTVAHLVLVLTAAPRLRSWLARPQVWLAVALAGRTAMTTFLWHLTGLVVGVGLLLAAGGNGFMGPVGSAAWWAWRPLWLVGLTAVTVPLVWLTHPVEHAATRASSGRCAPGSARLIVAVVAGCAGAALLALDGFTTTAPHGIAAVGRLNAGAFAVLLAAAACGAVPTRRALG